MGNQSPDLMVTRLKACFEPILGEKLWLNILRGSNFRAMYEIGDQVAS